MKFSVELNSAPKQNTRFSSSLQTVPSKIYIVVGRVLRVVFFCFTFCLFVRLLFVFFYLFFIFIFYLFTYLLTCFFKSEFVNLVIFRYFIIVSCRLHGYPWPSLATSPYHSSPLAGLQGYVPYPHIAAVCLFVLVVLLLLGHMRGSIGVHHLWARPCFSSSVLHVWFV